MFLFLAIVYWLTGILYFRQIASIDHLVHQYIIFAMFMLAGVMFSIGFIMEVQK